MNIYIESVDQAARELELKWGPGRLRLLVDENMRAKFDRQRVKFNDAVWTYDNRKIEKHAQAMRRAWQALDRAADAAGATPLDPEIFETVLADGSVLAVCRDNADAYVAAHRFKADGRQVIVWSMEEIARIVDAVPSLVDIKRYFPGAKVEAVKTPVPDELNDELPF